MIVTDNALRTGVLAGLAYFDLFGHPLTLAEALRFRYCAGGGSVAAAPGDVLAALGDPRVGERNGFYFLCGSDDLVGKRMMRQRIAVEKFGQARLAAAAFRAIPGIKFIAVCNSLAFGAANEDSDIDLFIAVDPGTIWRARLAAASLMHGLGMRPTDHDQKNKICLSFFASTDALDLSAVAIGEDPYLRYWIATLTPLYDAGGIHRRFLEANMWAWEKTPPPHTVARKPSTETPRKKISSPFERLAKTVQEKKFPAIIRELMNKDTRVVVNDDMLKFHVNDRRQEYAQRFAARLASLEIAV